MATVQELGARVKAKYAGAYDDLDDVDLGRRVQAKFPGAYDDFTDSFRAADAATAPESVSGQLPREPARRMVSPTRRDLGAPARDPAPRGGAGPRSRGAVSAQLEVEPTIERELEPVPPAVGPPLTREAALRILAERGDPRAAVINPNLTAPSRIAGVGANRPRQVLRPRRDRAGRVVEQDLSVTPDSTVTSRAEDFARNYLFGEIPLDRRGDVERNRVNVPLLLPSPEEAERITDENVQRVVAGLRGVSQVAAGLTTPESVAMLAGTAGAGALARGAATITGRVAGELADAFVAAGFSGELAAGMVEAINTGRTAATPAQAIEAYTAGGVQGLLAAMGLRHSVRAGRSAARSAPGAARETARGVREGLRPGGRFRGPAEPEVIPPERGVSTERVIEPDVEVPPIDIRAEQPPPGGLRPGRAPRAAPAIERPSPATRRLRAAPERPAPRAEKPALPEAAPRGTREARIVQGDRIERVFYGEPVLGRDGLEVRPVRVTEPPRERLALPEAERRLLAAGEQSALPFARPLAEKTVRMRGGRTAKLLSDGTVRITGLVPRGIAAREKLIREARDALNIFPPRPGLQTSATRPALGPKPKPTPRKPETPRRPARNTVADKSPTATLDTAAPSSSSGKAAEIVKQPRAAAIRAQGSRARVKTTRGTDVDTRYAVVEASELVTSNRDNLAVEPRFPQELQPRDRTRLSSEEQISRLESQLDPELLAENIQASQGAPIVGADAVVESGNARSIAIRRAYRKQLPTAKRYREFLRDNAQRFGLTPAQVEGLRQPVLVRVRETPVDRAQFAVEANEATVAGFSATEQAASDAGRLTQDLLDSFQPAESGELLTEANREFFRSFMRGVVSPAERGRLMDPKGRISQEGLARVRNAIFQRAYRDPRAVARLAESADNNARNISAGMLRAAPKLAKLSDAIARGQRYDLGISGQLAEAAETIGSLREKGASVDDFLRQENLFGERDTLVDRLVEVLDRHKRSGKKLGDILSTYADTVEQLGSPKQLQMFSGPRPTRGEILETAVRLVEAEGHVPDTRQARLFGGDPAELPPAEGQVRARAADPRKRRAAAGDVHEGAPRPKLGTPAKKPNRDPRRGAISTDFLTLGLSRKLAPDTAEQLAKSINPKEPPRAHRSLLSDAAEMLILPLETVIERQGGGAGRDLMAAVRKAKDLGEVSGGKRLVRLMDAGLHKLSREQDFALLDRMEGRLADSEDLAVEEAFQAARSLTDEIAAEAVDLGVKVRTRRSAERPGDERQPPLFDANELPVAPAAATARAKRVPFQRREDYFPHIVRDLDMLKSGEVRKDIITNLVRRGIRSNEPSAAMFLDRYIAFREGQPPHAELVDYLVRTKQAKTREDAFARLLRMRRDPSPRRHGNIEFAREVDLPFYDPRPSRVLPAEVAGVSMRLAEIAMLGQENQVVKRELLKVADAGGNVEVITRSLDRVLGWVNEADTPAERVSRYLRVVQGFKLGLAAIPNSTQHLATLMASDLPSFAAGARAAASKQGRRLAIESGAASSLVLEESLRAMAGSSRKLDRYLRAVGFTATERANRIVAANVGARYAKRLMEQAKTADVELRPAGDAFSAAQRGILARGSRGNRKRRERALAGLRELGIELAPGQTELTADDLLLAAKRMSDATQFRARPEDMPIWASTPAGKVLFQFKNFAYNQARFTYRSVIGEARKGNYGRAFRNLLILATLYPLAGEGVVAVRNFLLGRERNDEGIERYLNNIVAVGSLGLISDVFEAGSNPYFTPGFWVGPTGGDVIDLHRALVAATKGNFGPLKRVALSRTPLVRVDLVRRGLGAVGVDLESVRAKRARWRRELRSGSASRRRQAIREIAAYNRSGPETRVVASELARER